jgi:hypothetical protein
MKRAILILASALGLGALAAGATSASTHTASMHLVAAVAPPTVSADSGPPPIYKHQVLPVTVSVSTVSPPTTKPVSTVSPPTTKPVPTTVGSFRVRAVTAVAHSAPTTLAPYQGTYNGIPFPPNPKVTIQYPDGSCGETGRAEATADHLNVIPDNVCVDGVLNYIIWCNDLTPAQQQAIKNMGCTALRMQPTPLTFTCADGTGTDLSAGQTCPGTKPTTTTTVKP